MLATVVITLSGTAPGISQDSIVDEAVKVNQQLWLDYNPTSILSEYRSLSTQISYRTIIPQVYNRFQVISTLDFRNKRERGLISGKALIKSFRLGGGVIYTQNTGARDNLEFRLSQGLTFDIPTIQQMTLNNYARIEERLQKTFDDSGWEAGFRFRYRIATQIALNGLHLEFTEGFYIPLEAEVFINLKKTERFNDLIRLSPGLGYRFKTGWRIETYLIFNRTKNITETNDKSSDFIMRVRVYSPPQRKDNGEGPPGKAPAFD
ncbi:DUF2490 domain-containing protein [Robiginitalea marina]|uniref:DUF2490 domain-containing protein n=1 Tax=Robiginitalea marina TaxID=2954105 RepID=A0ABT1AVM6_9FLAO|nr:DUF2490 domain-containing protein [Robiginitalea marina]MCO5724120.1 DUF2490 domain-containing protein [Robiginitalea marina]